MTQIARIQRRNLFYAAAIGTDEGTGETVRQSAVSDFREAAT
jgi:hypothetical protein